MKKIYKDKLQNYFNNHIDVIKKPEQLCPQKFMKFQVFCLVVL